MHSRVDFVVPTSAMKLRMGMSRVGALTGTPVVRIAPTLQPHTHHEPLPIVVLPDSITPFAPIRRGSGIVLTGVRGVDGVAMVCKDFPSKPQGQREYLTTRCSLTMTDLLVTTCLLGSWALASPFTAVVLLLSLHGLFVQWDNSGARLLLLANS